MATIINFENKKISYAYILTAIILCVLFQILIIKLFSIDAIYIILGLIFILIFLIHLKSSVQYFPVLLLMINFIPLIYLNNRFHYSLPLLLLTSIPIQTLYFLAITNHLGNSSSISFSIGHLKKPILLFVLYFLIIGIWDVFNNQNLYWIAHQFFHVSLYLLVFPISYFFTKRKYYHSIYALLLVIYLIISAEYILINQFFLNYRFVTFQSGTFPLIIGPVFTFILFNKNLSKKIIATIILLILIWGAFITLTRALWIASILTLLISWLFYLRFESNYSYKKILLILLFLSAPVLFIGDLSQNNISPKDNNEQLIYKTESVIKPMEDSSFLMRIEFAYYSFQRFLDSPLFGKGFGDYLKYKIFNPFNKDANYYIDNSWFFILWKGGLIGILLFVWIYIRFLKSVLYVIVRTKNLEVKYMCIGLLAGVISICVLGLFSPLLVKYKTIAIVALALAYVQFERKEIADTQT